MKRRIIAWLLVLSMVMGNGASTVYAQEPGVGDIQPVTEESAGEVNEYGDVSISDSDLFDSKDDENKADEEKSEDAEDSESKKESDTASEEGSETETEAGTEDESEAGKEKPESKDEKETGENGFIKITGETVVYGDVERTKELCTVSEDAVVYAEIGQAEDSEEKVVKVFFDTEDGDSYEGYINPEDIAFLNEDDELIGSASKSRDYNGLFITFITVIPATDVTEEIYAADGLWEYKVVDGYATIMGYKDFEAGDLSIPDKVDGYFVNAIGEKAFVKNTGLSELYIHGNVVSISEDAFADNKVRLSGFNGTKALYFAKKHDMSFENKTDIEGTVFKDNVVDFSYADESRYEYADEYVIRMNLPEAANLEEGSIFYIPKVYSDIMRVYRVESMDIQSDYAIINVAEAQTEEAFVHVEVSEDLHADWDEAVWEDYVEVVEEKFSGSHGINEKIVLNYDKKINDYIKLSGGAEFGVKGELSYDADINSFNPANWVNSFDIKVDIDGQASGGIKVSGDNDDKHKKQVEKTRNGYFKTGNLNSIEKKEYDLLLGAVPLNGRDAKTSVYVGLYLRFAISGEVKIVSKLHGTMLDISYKKGSGWSRSHNIQWDPLSISAAVDIDFGLAAIAEAKCWGIGKVAKIDAFAGLNVSAKADMEILKSFAAEYTTEENAGGASTWEENGLICADIEINVKAELTFSTDIDCFRKIIDKNTDWPLKGKTTYTLLEWKWELKKWHLECKIGEMFSGGWKVVDKCTNSFVNIDFFTGTGEKLNRLRVKNNTALGTANEPTTDTSSGKKYIIKNNIGDLEGWYVYENCKGPEEYAKGKGSKRKWDFAKDVVKGDMTLYAEWRNVKTCDVIFKPNFTSTDPKKPVPDDIKETATIDALLTNPGQMKRAEYRFQGWFLDEAATTKWDFSKDTVTQDKLTSGKLILYAGWKYEKDYDPYKVEEVSSGKMSFNGHSYTHVATYKSYAEAEADAKRQGGYLCTINSAEEQAFLAKYMYEDCAQTYLWLGMVNEDGWDYWKTGEKVTYTNWNGAPVSSADKYNAAIIRSSGKWTTLSNTKTAHYVIEWGAPSVDPTYHKTLKSDITFTPNGDGKTASVTGVNYTLLSEKKNVAIPEITPDGLTVTGIVAGAFKGNNKLQQISIPGTVTKIEANAFENCTALKSIVIPDSVTSVGGSAFKGCTSLENVRWTASATTIPAYAFQNCTSLVTITNIDNVTAIYTGAFKNNTALNSFRFPEKLTRLDSEAFHSDSSLREIVLPDSLTTINSYTFYGCTSVYKISLPDSTRYIYNYAFTNCKSASDIYMPKSTSSGCIYNAFNYVDGTFHVYQGSGSDEWCKKNNKKIEYLGAKQKIKFSAGEGQAYEPTSKDGDMLSEMYIEAGKRITEPKVEREGMVIEGWYLEPEFVTKWNFVKDKVPDHGVTLYAKWITNEDDFEYDVISGAAQILEYNGSSEQVIIPNKLGGYTVTHILSGAFGGSRVKEIVIPASVKSIASGAFNCSNLEKITLKGDKYYDVHEDGVLYSKNGKTLIYAPQGVNYYSYEVPDEVTKIASYAFGGHSELEKVVIPDSVTSIGGNAFNGNHTVTLYGSVNTCAAKTYASKNLLPYNMYTVHYMYDDGAMFSASHQAGTLIEDYFEPMDNFFSFGGWYRDAQTTTQWNFRTDRMPQSELTLYLKWDTLFDIAVVDDTINITGYRGTGTSIVIPETIGGKSVVGIDQGAFTRSKAKTIQIPDCVVNIEDGAFPANVTLICSSGSAAKTYAVNNNIKYKGIKYKIHFEVLGGSEVADISLAPGKTTTLPCPVRSNYYFYGWYTDTTFTEEVQFTDTTRMPSNDVTLYACWKSATTDVTNDFLYKLLSDGTVSVTGYGGTKTVLSVPDTLNGYTVTAIGDNAFEGNDTILSITLPDSVTSIGKYAFARSAVRTVKGAASLSKIGEGAFMNASALSKINLTGKLRTIGDSAFQGCIGLTGISIPNGTTTIGYRAFYGCEYLESVTFAATLKSLGKESFANCPRLTNVSLPSSLTNVAEDAFDESAQVGFKASKAINILSQTVSGKKITITWNKVKDASSYAVESKKSSESAYTKSAEVTTASATITCNYNAKYNIRVLALDANGKTISKSDAITVYFSKIATPAIESVTQKDASSATMKLTAVTGADGYEVERAYSENDSFDLIKTVTTDTFTNTGLIKGFDYYYRVRAYKVGTDGKKSYSAYSDVYHFHMPGKYLNAPENVCVRQSAADAAVITWDAVEEAEGYAVYRSINGGAFKKIKQLNATSFKHKGLAEGTEYSYKVVSFFTENGQQKNSKYSATVKITIKSLATPVFKTVRQSKADTVSFTWSAVTGATGYKIYRADTSNGTKQVIATVKGATKGSYKVALESGKTYYFTVRAYKTGDDGKAVYGSYSPEFALTCKDVVQVTGLKVSQKDGTTASLTWSAITGVGGYEVWMSSVNDNNFELAATATNNSADISKLKDGVTYYFKVRGFTLVGGERVYGDFSSAASISILGIPSLSAVEQNAKTSAQILWNKVGSADGYEVYYKIGDGEYALAKRLTNNTFTMKNLTADTQYTYKVRAYRVVNDERQYGFFSNEKKVYILGTTKIKSVTRSGDQTATISWNAVQNADGYYLQRSNLSNGIFEKIASLTTLSYKDNNLTIGEAYYYRVVPYKKIGKAVSEGRPTASVGIRMLAKPVISTIEQTSANALTLTWQAVPNATCYNVYMSQKQGGKYTLAGTVNTTTMTLNDLAQEKWYYFVIAAGSEEDGTTYLGQKSEEMRAYVTNLATPVISTLAQADTGKLTVKWNKVSGASGYEIFRSGSLNGQYTSLQLVSGASYNDTNVYEGSTYYYKVRPYKTVNGTNVFGFVSETVGATIIGTTSIDRIDRTSAKRADLYWHSVAKATGYNIYRSDSKNGTYKLITTTTELTAFDGKVVPGSTYYYKVAAVVSNGSVNSRGPMSETKGLTAHDIAAPKISSVQQVGSAKVTVKWKAVTGATGYELFVAEAGSDQFTKVKKLTATSLSTTTNLEDGKEYQYRVRAYITENTKTKYGPYSAVKNIILMGGASLDELYQTSVKAVTINCSASCEVTGFDIYRKTTGDYALLASVEGSTYEDKTVKKGSTFTYKVRPYRMDGTVKSYGGFSSEVSIKPVAMGTDPYPQSVHNYANNMDQSWTYTIKGAKALRVSFTADTRLENRYDKIYITDSQGNAIGKEYWTGTELASKAVIIPGDTLNLRMTTDGSVNYYGFAIDSIAPCGQ